MKGTGPACGNTGWAAQFGNPKGWRGVLIGRLMAIKNAAMGRLAVEALEVREHDRVLEIGFGHGKAVAEAARWATRGLVAGVDTSPVMVRQAGRRNHRAIAEGRVELRRAEAARLPYPDASFDRVFEVNSLHHWPDAPAGLREIRRVLAKGGRVLLSLRMKHPTRTLLAAPGYTEREVEEVCGLVERAGFRNVRTVAGRAGRQVTCVLAER